VNRRSSVQREGSHKQKAVMFAASRWVSCCMHCVIVGYTGLCQTCAPADIHYCNWLHPRVLCCTTITACLAADLCSYVKLTVGLFVTHIACLPQARLALLCFECLLPPV
jgi:hypothetical protein